MDGWGNRKHQITNNKFQLIIGLPALLEFGTCSLELIKKYWLILHYEDR